MTISAFTTGGDWAVITSDNADDVYLKQVATVPQDLLIADNASFLEAQAIGEIDTYRTVYVTNGTAVSAGGLQADGFGDSTTTTFVLGRGSVQTERMISGTVSYGGGLWVFDNGGSGTVFSLKPANTAGPIAFVYPTRVRLQPAFIGEVSTGGGIGGGAAASVTGDDSIVIEWSNPPVAAGGISQPVLTEVSYFYSSGTVAAGGELLLSRSAGSQPTIRLPVTPVNPGGIVPGTLSGRLYVSNTWLDFRTDSLFGNRLFFENGTTPGTTGIFEAFTGEGARASQRQVEGRVDFQTGAIDLWFWTPPTGTPARRVAQDPGPVSISASYAVYNQDARSSEVTFAAGQDFTRELEVDLLTPNSALNADSRILANPSLADISLRATNININAQMRAADRINVGGSAVDRIAVVAQARGRAIVSAGSIVGIGIPAGAGGQGYDDDPDKVINVTITGGGGTGATARAISENGTIVRVEMISAGRGYTSIPTVTIDPPSPTDMLGDERFPLLSTALAESMSVNASVAAGIYDLRIADDPATAHTQRGKLFVSSSGSLAGALAASAAAATTPASSIYVQADTSDIYVEGTINGSLQSYLLRSPTINSLLAPYTLTTVSPRTGAQTGVIRGGTVDVTLGNDAPTPEQSSVAANTVDLGTQIDSFRIRAATRKGEPLAGAFPYDLEIREVDNISFDAVAASSRPISLSAGGDIGFSAALVTGGDLSINANRNFAVSAPLTTVRGAIRISGATVAVNNSIRVLDPAADAAKDDIVLTATAGDLSLTGAVSGVNRIRLVQRNRNGSVGKIFGPSRVVAQSVVVEAEGSASLRTEAEALEGRSGGDFAVDELDDINILALRAPGLVSLRAAGVDPGLAKSASRSPVALTASLTDVISLEASAPRGSVNVVTNTTKLLTVGNAAAVASGQAAALQAAGAVAIRSTAGPVAAVDAPIGGGAAIAVRVATVSNLPSTFSYGRPGFFASTLTGSRAALVIDGIALRVGDRVLVKDQTNANENGVYAVTVAGSPGRAWVLTRSMDADTSAELPANSYVQVYEGGAAGHVFQIGYETTFGTSALAVKTASNRSGTVRVRVASTSSLTGAYDPTAGVLSASGVLPRMDGVTLRVGDRVLLKDQVSSEENGVYEVVSVGAVAGAWRLRRATDVDTGELIETGYVATTEGSFRTATTGSVFLVAFDPLGLDGMSVTEVDGIRPATNIGTEDINDTTTFVVSSTAGANDSAGSLGKMLALVQANDTSSSPLNRDQKTAFAFASSLPGLNGAPAGVIRLTQELPAISKAFAIDGATRVQLPGATGPATKNIFVDGSRITTTRGGQFAAIAPEVNGFEFQPGSSSVPGLAGGSIANVTIGGFAKGAAVKVNGGSGILLNAVTLGRNEGGDRLANRYGALVTGAGSEATLLNSRVVGSTEAGVRVGPGATGVTVAGSAIGAANQTNKVGIELAAGMSRIGVNPMPSKLPAVQLTLGVQGFLFNAPAATLKSLFVGQTVNGNGIPNGTSVAAIHGNVITMSKPATGTVVTNVRFGLPTRNIIEQNLTGIAMSGGANVVTNSDIGNNVYDGISITGGVQQIGQAKKVDSQSNVIYGNGRAGVAVTGASQSIIGNTFGSRGLNRGNNVIVNGVVPRSYQPLNSRVTTDSFGNNHAPASGGAGTRKPTWRG